LSVYKQDSHFRDAQVSHKWIKHRGLRELYGKNICILGCGSVGNECAKRFSAMGCRVYGVDLTPSNDNLYSYILPLNQLSEAIASADILVLTLPLTNDTYHLIGERELNLLRDESVIVNISRGGIIDTEALIDVLRRTNITAVLDVFEEEPLAYDNPLWIRPNVRITPHNSFVGEGNTDRMWQVVISNLRDNHNRCD
jgi:phosphoglycerate dehydrogenase-like enzyme